SGLRLSERNSTTCFIGIIILDSMPPQTAELANQAKLHPIWSGAAFSSLLECSERNVHCIHRCTQFRIDKSVCHKQVSSDPLREILEIAERVSITRDKITLAVLDVGAGAKAINLQLERCNRRNRMIGNGGRGAWDVGCGGARVNYSWKMHSDYRF